MWTSKANNSIVDALERISPISIPHHPRDKLERHLGCLSILTQYDNLNHVFLHTHGGLDMEKVDFTKEKGPLLLIHEIMLKPSSVLYFEMDDNQEWNYLKLEATRLNLLQETLKKILKIYGMMLNLKMKQ